ncbi:hypothetical protein P8C59_001238 [Phyllachora maydis]|uniref:PHD-type domain-containing protein n=1 Tax=Phyllachora maydis TaxID=1825666 RepID=A0AAD9M9Z1_9PEZI|nr:hypothetical protein P8C59_001238 [Phyllachora maydis]
MEDSLTPLDTRADPDAQSTVTDFLDFTEYLPADMIRSLTLIGNLDRRYVDASMALHDQTTTWGELPLLPADSRPAPAQLRLDISENLHHTVGSRVYSHTEAKLTTMLENYPTAAEQEKTAATLSKSPQLSRAPKTTSRLDGQKARRPRVPRITVPGEVLAPYDLNYDAYSTGSDISSSSEEENGEETRSNVNGTTSAPPRIKLVKGASGFPKPHKAYKSRTSVPPPAFSGSTPSTSAALLMLKPPPENAVIGSADAPWGQLTPTARNTPAPEKADASATRLIVKRAKRPAPGVISRTNSGGNSAVGARKAAPRRKKSARKSTRGDKSASGGGIGDMTEHEVEIEVDDEGKAIDPEEPRYCLCNRVSFGMMIECDNVDNCKNEWFHLECVGLVNLPARTSKWYCPDCRKALGLGGKGEVNARGVNT